MRQMWPESNGNFYLNFGTTGKDLGGGCRGCTPPTWGEAFFVFTIKICLPHQSVTPFLSGAPLLSKILDPPLHNWMTKN